MVQIRIRCRVSRLGFNDIFKYLVGVKDFFGMFHFFVIRGDVTSFESGGGGDGDGNVDHYIFSRHKARLFAVGIGVEAVTQIDGDEFRGRMFSYKTIPYLPVWYIVGDGRFTAIRK